MVSHDQLLQLTLLILINSVSSSVTQDASALIKGHVSAVVKQKASEVLTEDACSTKLCSCHKNNTFINCSGKNLTYFPVLPNTVKQFRFRNNFMPHITAKSLLNLTLVSLQSLEMRHCHIRIIDKGVLENLKYLELLDLSYNLLTTDSLYNVCITSTNSSLRSLILQQTGITSIPPYLFQNFTSVNPFGLDLSENSIRTFNFTVLRSIKRIEALSLAANGISSPVTFDQLPHLKNLTLTHNKLSEVPNFCPGRIAFFTNLEELRLFNNSITNWNPVNVNCMKNLSILELSYNTIGIIPTDSFNDFPSLKYLRLVQQRSLDGLHIQASAFNNSRLESLFLGRNIITTDYLHEDAFKGCGHLSYLDIPYNDFFHNWEKLNVILSPLVALQKLNLHYTHLTRVPEVIGQKLHEIRYLDISFNNLMFWPKDTFRNNTHLHIFKAFGNHIHTVTRQMLPGYLRKRLRWIDLGANEYICNCDLLWFIGVIHRESKKFIGYPRAYKCLNMTERVCLQNTSAFISLTTVVCVLLVVLVLSSMVYKNRWLIKYHIYMWRYRPLKLLNIQNKHFIYDAFVSYCIEDGDWVIDRLLPIMEGNENRKLCIHQRDFEGGKLIIDNIIHHMENSRKIVIILTNDFAKSEWCQFEMSLAQKLVLDMSIESVVVVLLEEIEAANMSNSLHALLKTTTYITWDENGEEEVLWRRLTDSLKRRDQPDL